MTSTVDEPEKEREPVLETTAGEPLANLHREEDLRSMFLLPLRALELVLSEQERLARTIASGRSSVLLVGALLYTSILFALPFGAVLGLDRFWRVALLFVGSLGICFPSLQVFSAYIGCRIDIRRNLALGLVITCVAALFTFGFFPILWFLRETMIADSETITLTHVSLVLLIFSLLAGIGHLYRCLYRFEGLVRSYPVLITIWQALFVFICYRMARLLDLL